MSCYLYIHNNNFKLQNLFPTTGAANPATTGTVSTVPNFFDQDDFLSFYSEYENEFRLPY